MAGDVKIYNNSVGINKWFGYGKRVTYAELTYIYSVIQKVRTGIDTRVRFTDTNSDYAVAWVNVFSTWIRIGKRFWNQTTKRQTGILFHEMTHYFADTGDFGYFDEGSLEHPFVTYNDRNRILSPYELTRNADTYEGFLENYYL